MEVVLVKATTFDEAMAKLALEDRRAKPADGGEPESEPAEPAE